MRGVVPYVGTWIEIRSAGRWDLQQRGRSLRGNVDRNDDPVIEVKIKSVVPYVGTWIEIFWKRLRKNTGQSRSLRGNVDRNSASHAEHIAILKVVPYVGTWIEICLVSLFHEIDGVVPYVGTWIEIETTIEDEPRVWESFPTWERG